MIYSTTKYNYGCLVVRTVTVALHYYMQYLLYLADKHSNDISCNSVDIFLQRDNDVLNKYKLQTNKFEFVSQSNIKSLNI